MNFSKAANLLVWLTPVAVLLGTPSTTLCACAEYGYRQYDCSEDELPSLQFALDAVAEQYPELGDLTKRLDFVCKDDVDTFQTCARSGAEDPSGCTAWYGSDFYRGKVYALKTTDLAKLVAHEAGHWYADFVLLDETGCAQHTADCWDQKAVDARARAIDEWRAQ